MTGPFGNWRVQAPPLPDSPQLLPGETWRVTVPVHGVTPALYLAATVTLVPLLTDAAGSTAPLAAADTAAHSWAVPWTLAAIVAVLAGLVIALLVRRRRRVPESSSSASILPVHLGFISRSSHGACSPYDGRPEGER